MSIAQDTSLLKMPWQIALGKTGEVLQGLGARDQEVKVALGTSIGSVPHLPEYGFDWHLIIDEPVSRARPIAAREVARVFRRWLPLVDLVDVQTSVIDEQTTLSVKWRPRGTGRDVTTVVSQP